jgi:hypothetical protein
VIRKQAGLGRENGVFLSGDGKTRNRGVPRGGVSNIISGTLAMTLFSVFAILQE